MIRYAVIDTNVIVSAMLKRSSVPGKILEAVFHGELVPVFHRAILNEYREVLLRDKFHLTDEIVNDLLTALEEQGEYVDPEPLQIDFPDPKDAIFYEVLMEKRKSENACLVTGNIRHFPAEQFVVTPREMLERLTS